MFKKSKSMHEVYSCPFPPKLPEGGQDIPTDDALLEERLSKLAYAFAPDFIVCEDCVFVADFLYHYGGTTPDTIEKTVRQLKKRFRGNVREMEMTVNSWSVVDALSVFEVMRLGSERISDAGIQYLAEAMAYFWRLRCASLFPDRNIKVELGYDIMGEYGLTITVYQV